MKMTPNGLILTMAIFSKCVTLLPNNIKIGKNVSYWGFYEAFKSWLLIHTNKKCNDATWLFWHQSAKWHCASGCIGRCRGAAGKSKIETNILKGPQNLHLLQCSVPPSELLAAAAPFNSTSVRYNCNSAQYEDNFEVWSQYVFQQKLNGWLL